MAKRPLVSATIRTEFGDVLETDAALQHGTRDLCYIPGFSDMRQARDLELAAVASGAKPKHLARIDPLPVNARWTRKTTPRGAPDGAKQISTGNLGYRSATKADIGQDWLTELPPGAILAADGTIEKGDTMLMVCDGKTAARNAARKDAQTRRIDRETVAAAGGLLAVGSKKEGLDPFIRTEP